MSIVQVSKLAGVSIATVSRVMNNPSSVSPEKLAAVRKAAQQVGYKSPTRKKRSPNRNGTVPAGVKKGAITLMFPDPNPAAMKTVLSGRLSYGINEELAKHGLTFMLSALVSWNRLPASIERGLVDGVILRGTVPVESYLAMIRPLPCVTVFESPKVPSYGDEILEDSTYVGEIAATFLIERGCKHLAVVTRDPLHPAYNARGDACLRSARYDGVESECHCAAVPIPELVDRLLANPVKPQGLFATGPDHEVIALYSELARRGVDVGGAFPVISVSYDPSRLSLGDLKLPYIDIQPELIGQEAVKALLARIENPSTPQERRLVSPQLVIPTSK